MTYVYELSVPNGFEGKTNFNTELQQEILYK